MSFFGKDQYIALVDKPSTLCVVPVEDPQSMHSFSYYFSYLCLGAADSLGIAEGKYGWHNKVPARAVLEVSCLMVLI